MEKKTTVEWLLEQISSSKYFYNLMEELESRSTTVQPNGILQQAKEMEKEIMHAEYMRGWKDGLTKQGPPTPPLDRKIYR